MHERAKIRGRFGALFPDVDFHMTQCVAVTAFTVGEIGANLVEGRVVDGHIGWSPFSWPINLAGLPAASICCGLDSSCLPIGLQIVGFWLSADPIFAAAATFTAVRGNGFQWPERAPCT